MRALPRTSLVLAGCMLAACLGRTPAPVIPEAPAALQAPAEFPQAFYRNAAAHGERVLQVDPRRSSVVIEVRRAGPLARLGHDHVVASREVQGFVLPSAGRADLFIPLARLTVDEPGLRAELAMETQPSPEAVEGTRRNMLDKVLDAERFPFALVRVSRKEGEVLRVVVTLHGTTREIDVPARIEATPESMSVSGRMTIAQSDFGITPFSVLGGALQVQDTLAMRYLIVAGSMPGN